MLLEVPTQPFVLHCKASLCTSDLFSSTSQVLSYSQLYAFFQATSHALFSLLWKRLSFSNPYPENTFSNPFNTDFFKETSQFITLQVLYTLTTTHKCKSVFTQILCAWISYEFFLIGTWIGLQCLLGDRVFCLAGIYMYIL